MRFKCKKRLGSKPNISRYKRLKEVNGKMKLIMRSASDLKFMRRKNTLKEFIKGNEKP